MDPQQPNEVKQRTVEMQQGGPGTVGLIAGAAIGAVVGEFAKRAVFGE